MIVTPRSDRSANEDTVDEESGRYFLRPEQWTAAHSRHDIKQGRRCEADQAHPAELHQYAFKRVQHRPLEVTIGDEDEVGAPIHRYWIERQTCRIFSAWGPSPLASLSCRGSAILIKLVLSTSATTLTPSFCSFASDLCSSAMACAGCCAGRLGRRRLVPRPSARRSATPTACR